MFLQSATVGKSTCYHPPHQSVFTISTRNKLWKSMVNVAYGWNATPLRSKTTETFPLPNWGNIIHSKTFDTRSDVLINRLSSTLKWKTTSWFNPSIFLVVLVYLHKDYKVIQCRRMILNNAVEFCSRYRTECRYQTYSYSTSSWWTWWPWWPYPLEYLWLSERK